MKMRGIIKIDMPKGGSLPLNSLPLFFPPFNRNQTDSQSRDNRIDATEGMNLTEDRQSFVNLEVRMKPSYGYVYGFLYAVKMLIPDYPFQPIKVGFSTKPLKRKNAYGSGPFPCEWLGMWRGTEQDELAFHIEFDSQRLAGEWFQPTDEMMTRIQSKIERYGKLESVQVPAWYRTPEFQAEQRAKAAEIMARVLG